MSSHLTSNFSQVATTTPLSLSLTRPRPFTRVEGKWQTSRWLTRRWEEAKTSRLKVRTELSETLAQWASLKRWWFYMPRCLSTCKLPKPCCCMFPSLIRYCHTLVTIDISKWENWKCLSQETLVHSFYAVIHGNAVTHLTLQPDTLIQFGMF